MARRRRMLALALLLVFAPALALYLRRADSDEPSRAARQVVSLSPLGTRALLAMGLADRLVFVDTESRARLPASLEMPSDPPAQAIGLALVRPDPKPLPFELDALVARAERVIVVDPHDLDEAGAFYDEIGEALDERAAAAATQRRIADLLGPIGAQSGGRERPCMVAIVALEPLTLAGGHSFESNVLELLGAESATHDRGTEHRIEVDRDLLRTLAPDLVLVTPAGLSPDALGALARDLAPIEVVPTFFDPEPIWLGDEAAARPQLEHWASLVERARERAGKRANCRPTA
jgi:ABC-type hemin transport system substrate-binding protein